MRYAALAVESKRRPQCGRETRTLLLATGSAPAWYCESCDKTFDKVMSENKINDEIVIMKYFGDGGGGVGG